MKKGNGWVGFFLLTSAATLSVAFAQTSFVPFHAKLQRVQQVFNSDGSLQSEQVLIDDYMRDSRGSSYTDSRIMNSLTGQMQASAKVIDNSRDQRIYLIDEAKKAVVISLRPISLKPYVPPPGGEEITYLGRKCIWLKNSEGEGELYLDVELGYPLYERREVPQAGGGKMIRINRVIDLAVHQEPDPGLFRLPVLDGYAIIDRTIR